MCYNFNNITILRVKLNIVYLLQFDLYHFETWCPNWKVNFNDSKPSPSLLLSNMKFDPNYIYLNSKLIYHKYFVNINLI